MSLEIYRKVFKAVFWSTLVLFLSTSFASSRLPILLASDIVSEPTYYSETEIPDLIEMPADLADDLLANMELSFSEAPILDQAVELSLIVEPEIDAPNVEICILLPEGFSLVDGSLLWNGDLAKNAIVKMNVSVKAVLNGDWRIEAVAISKPINSYPKVCSTRCYISVAENKASISSVASEETARMEAVRLDGTENIENGIMEPLSPGTVTVCGYWYYEDQNYNQKPCRYAKVELWDSDSPVDVLLATTYVQSDGRYQFPAIPNDDGYLEDGYDVYVKVFCDSYQYPIVYVTNGINTYWGQTDQHSDVADGLHDMGSWIITGSQRGCWGLYDSTVDAYWWLRNRVGWFRSEVLVRWPYETWPHTHGNVIDIPSGWEWDQMTQHHEYAHCIHYEARGGSWPPGNGPYTHYIFSESSGGFALTEGWAEFIQCAVDNRGDYGFGTGQSIESNTWADYIDSGDWDGNIVEGAVASILWDISDGTSGIDEGWGDYVDQEFNKLWTVFLNDGPNDMQTDFWNGWASRYSVDFNLWAIYYGSRINKDTTPPSAPTISSPTHPDQNTWYSNNDPAFEWATPSDLSGIAGYSYVLDQHSSTTPDTTIDTTENSKSYTDLAGTWYFHVRAKDNAGNWGSTDHYRVNISTECQVTFHTDPTGTGFNITFKGKTYYDNDDDTFTYATSDLATANAPIDWQFDHWEVTDNIAVSDQNANPTIVTVTCGGTLKAVFVEKPEGPIVYVFEGTVSAKTDSPQHQFQVPGGTTKIEVLLEMPSSADFDLSLWDNSERRTGGYTSYESIKRIDIPNSEYSGFSAKPEWIIVEPPTTTGIWKVGCYGYSGSGTYKITVSLYGELEEYNVHLESVEDIDATSNLGTIKFNEIDYNLPDDIIVSTGTYDVQYFPVEGYIFDHWETTGEVSVLVITDNPTSITVDADGTLRAIYKTPLLYNINLESSQDNTASSNLGTIRFDVTFYSLPTNIAEPAGTYTAEYIADTGYLFDHWETTGDVSIADSTNNPATVTISGIAVLRAVYKEKPEGPTTYVFDGEIPTKTSSPQHQFQVPGGTNKIEVLLEMPGSADFDLSLWDNLDRRTGGYLSTDPKKRIDIPNSEYSGFFARPEWITVEPPATTGVWKVGCYSYSGSGAYKITVKIHGATEECTVTFFTDPTGSSYNITFQGESYHNDVTDTFPYGTSGSATAYCPTGWGFDHWIVTGNIAVSDQDANPTTVIITCGGTLKAVFVEEPECAVTFHTVPTTAGTITFGDQTYTDSETATFPYGTTGLATANPPEGWILDYWEASGNIDLSNEKDNPVTITITCGGTLTAVFVEQPEWPITYVFEGPISPKTDSPQHQFQVPSGTTKIEIQLEIPDGADFDLSLWDNLGRRTGGYTSFESKKRMDIPNSEYSGFFAKPEWITVEPPATTGVWKAGCYAYSGSGTYKITVKLYGT